MLIGLLDGFSSFNTIQFWFDHAYGLFALFATFCLVAPLLSKVVTVGPGELRPMTLGIVFIGLAVVAVAYVIVTALIHP